ncbi:PSD1 and planctomycete cytochrome C domain-containing protein, partial [Singulisphaera rosea]
MVDRPKGSDRPGHRGALLWSQLGTTVLILGLAQVRVFAADVVDFNRDIRPILSGKCFTCHGPDQPRRKAGLRLDTSEGTFQPAKSGNRAVVPGKLDESEIFRRITSDDDDERMPPTKDGKPLTSQEVGLFKAWITQGAPYGKHWAFVPPVKPEAPRAGDGTWRRNGIDDFILDRLEKEGLHPSSEADKVTLLRRLSLDLIGLPPGIAEIDRFVSNQASDAYETEVERLLASPHYGERWARVWLDAARYADSDGYEKDKSRQVWFYRDWVINAINRDLPYDRFIVEQIAGDLLPSATQDQVVATGFLRNSMINEEGGVDPEQFRMEAMFDRMDAIGKGILGLTIQCAQCHSHKFDPLTQDEYYGLFAFLNNTHESDIAVYSPTEQAERSGLRRQMGEIEADLKRRYPDWAARMAAWEEKAKNDQPEWVVVHPSVEAISNDGQRYLALPDGSLLAQGYAPTKHRPKLTVETSLRGITAFRLELLNDPNLPRNGPGRSYKGTGALTEFEVEVSSPGSPEKVRPIKIREATADVNPPVTPLEPIFDDKSGKTRVTGPIGFAVDGNHETAWETGGGTGRRNQPRKAVFQAEAPITQEGGSVLTFHLRQDHGGWNSDDNQNNNLGRFRISITTSPNAQADPLPQHVRAILGIPRESRSPEQVAEVFSYWRTTVPEWVAENARVQDLWSHDPKGTTQLVLQERDMLRETHRLHRGDFLKPEALVKPGVPSFLHRLPASAASAPNRLSFARWLADRGSPTTARAFVNRVWQAYFGTGLVSTSEDLGSQSEAPSHPELLDWLAVDFMDRGWKIKDFHRLLVCSATYRQSSRVTPDLVAKDPYNRLLARGPRFRVDAEVVRDIAL